MYDCAVVGAGPAGSTFARSLAQKGHSVILFDKKDFPRDKPCGGGFPLSLLHDFPYLQSKRNEFLKTICRIGVIHSPNREIVLKGQVDMAVALRYNLDNTLRDSALEIGAEPVTSRVKRITFKKDYVLIQTSDKDYQTRVVVGADGIGSVVARDSNLHKRWHSGSITACRVAEIPLTEKIVDDIYTPDREYHFYSNLEGKPGYAWIFPKEDTVNVGLGIVATNALGLPRRFDSFIRFLKKRRLLPQELDATGAKGALVPTGGALKKSFRDRCILVGDSAGMVSPITGGGIAYSMRAARHGAAVVSNALEHDAVDEERLKRYQQKWMNDFGKDMPMMVRAQKILTSSYTDLLFTIAHRDDTIQRMVSQAMTESSDESISIKQILARLCYVCLRESFGMS